MFWIAVMTGVIFAVVGIRRGFYPTWAFVFNILISIYLAVMLTPAVIEFIPNVDNFHYHQAVCIGGIAIIVFLVLQTIAAFLIGTFEASFPRIFDTIFAGALGFLSGYLVCIFVFFVFCVIPFSKQKQKLISWQENLSQTALTPVITVCDFVGKVSLHTCDGVASKAVGKLISARDRSGDESDYQEQSSFETGDIYEETDALYE